MFDILDVLKPKSLDEAKRLFASRPDLKPIAGGTDVLIRAHHHDIADVALLSLRDVTELKGIRLDADGTISIGPMTCFSDIFRDATVNKFIPSLAEGAVSMGGPQIRNMATIGGNVCNGATSGDSASTLFALDALLTLETATETRTIPIAEFYAGPGKVNLKPGELLTRILIPKKSYEGIGCNYIKYSVRKAMDIATLGVSVATRLSGGKLKDVKIGLGVAAPTPIRCAEAEAWAEGKDPTDANFAEIGKLAVTTAKARDSWRASKKYREHLIAVLTERALKESVKRAGGK